MNEGVFNKFRVLSDIAFQYNSSEELEKIAESLTSAVIIKIQNDLNFVKAYIDFQFIDDIYRLDESDALVVLGMLELIIFRYKLQEFVNRFL